MNMAPDGAYGGLALPDEALAGPGQDAPEHDRPVAVPAILRLAVTDFRCYGRAELDLDGRIVVLTGANGAGKTNLLEALSFLAPGRGLRRAALGEVERIGGPGTGWAVAARLETGAGPVDIGTGRRPEQGERRIVRIGGVEQRGQTALAERLAVAWLTPQMDRLFIEGAGNRRRFLDRMVYGHDGGHAARLSAYEHAMRERARLLKERRIERSWLDALEDTMAREGIAVALARRHMIERLGEAVGEAIGPFPAALLDLDGEWERALGDAAPDAVEDAFRRRLADLRRIDGDAGATTSGPHRGDLKVSHRAKQVPAERCSTGEQKALLIALTLANARLIAARRGHPPLLLLDEVAAHLDAERRAALYDELAALGGQSWLTGTDRELFRPLADRAQHLTVEDGRVAPMDSPLARPGRMTQ